jgi:CubicO group peptidase (beta-lactamase class C family)
MEHRDLCNSRGRSMSDKSKSRNDRHRHGGGSNARMGWIRDMDSQNKGIGRDRDVGKSALSGGIYAFLAATVLLLGTAAGCATAPIASSSPVVEGSRDRAIERLSAFIPGEMKKQGIRGLSIVVADGNGTLMSAGFGFSDGTSKRKFGASTVSNVASVSKLFTSAAIMRLVEEGRIDLDAPVSAYLPAFSPRGGDWSVSDVTVRGLLTHHSGLQSDYFRGFSTGAAKPAGYPRPYAENVTLASETRLCAGPDEVFSYSNLGYSLLGLIVEKVSGQDFNSYMRDAIFAPLGMDSSSFVFENRFADRYAKGVAGFDRNVPIPYFRDMPAGSLNSSADDMGRFLSAAIRSGEGNADGLLKPDTMREVWTRQNESSALDFDFSIGLTWWLMELPGLPGELVVGHGGDLPPFHALLLVDPARSLGVAILVNSAKGLGSFSLAGIATEAIRDFSVPNGKGPGLPEALPPPTDAPFPPGLVASLVGNYASPNGYLRVRAHGQGLDIFAFGTWMKGSYRSDGSIGLHAKFLGIELPIPILKQVFATAERLGDETMLALRSGGILLGVARKVEAHEVRPAWRARLGGWVPLEKEPAPIMEGAALSLDKDTGLFFFVMKSGGQSEAYPIRAIADDEAITEGSGRNLGASLRIIMKDGIEILDAFGVKLRKR